MPTYTYKCNKCGLTLDRSVSIKDMEEFERSPMQHADCGGDWKRLYVPLGRAIEFKEGWYEHCGPDPIYARNMGDVERACEKNGLTSAYAQDFGRSIFKSDRPTRWV